MENPNRKYRVTIEVEVSDRDKKRLDSENENDLDFIHNEINWGSGSFENLKTLNIEVVKWPNLSI